MKVLKTKTKRFSDVVDKAGKPQVYTLWQKPPQDRHLQSDQKPPGDDDFENRRRIGIWNRRFQGTKGGELFDFSEIVEAIRKQSDRGNQLGLRQNTMSASRDWR